MLGLRYGGLCDANATNGVTGYVQWVEHPFYRYLRRAEYNLWLNWPMVASLRADVIARVIEPNAVETQDNYIGWFPQPPGAVSEYAAVTERKLGSGRAIYCVSPLTWFVPNPAPKYDVDVQWPTTLLRGIIEHLGVGPGIRISGPAGVEATFHRRGAELIVHLLNRTIGTSGAGNAPAGSLPSAVAAIHGVSIHVDREPASIESARLVYPDDHALAVESTDDEISIPVPPIEMHSIVVLR